MVSSEEEEEEVDHPSSCANSNVDVEYCMCLLLMVVVVVVVVVVLVLAIVNNQPLPIVLASFMIAKKKFLKCYCLYWLEIEFGSNVFLPLLSSCRLFFRYTNTNTPSYWKILREGILVM